MYLLYKDGLLPSDIRLLCNHARLPPQEEEVLRNLELLGARAYKNLKDQKPPPQPLFPRKPPPTANTEEYGLSRFETNLKQMLDQHVSGTLDPVNFPFTKPDLAAQTMDPTANISSASLRSAKPTWAKSKLTSIEPRQRVIVFMAGGATYSESRACYEISDQTTRDVMLVTSHMLAPSLWMRQVSDLSVERRRLGIPQDQPPKKAPAYLFEEDKPKPPPVSKNPLSQPQPGLRPSPAPAPPAKQMGAMSLNGGGVPAYRPPGSSTPNNGPIKLGDSAESKLRKEHKEKKKHHFFGSSKK
jgi:syntaxin-binding protein 1